MEKVDRHVIEAERRLKAQASWIEELEHLGYDTVEEKAVLDRMRGELLRARAELARLLAQNTAYDKVSHRADTSHGLFLPDG
ncbi:hypothetical protein [Azohydromonas aeria]|uniref:hypothetical protein n=1 Tax=Azohydromonas aeria TaxID=2590212 RepID=UPI0012FB7540|nr:hypothetical protein [Azohydromonas aeria]